VLSVLFNVALAVTNRKKTSVLPILRHRSRTTLRRINSIYISFALVQGSPVTILEYLLDLIRVSVRTSGKWRL
jgi:hypothetical protein